MVPRSDCARSADASCTAFQEIDAHKTPLSSRMISESGFPDAWPSLSASACRSSSDILGASERPWGGVRRPASTNLRTAASSSLSVSSGEPDASSGEPDASSGAIWMRTLEFSCKSNGCKGRRSPSLYTAVTVIASVIIHLNSLGRCTPFLWYAILMVRHSYGATFLWRDMRFIHASIIPQKRAPDRIHLWDRERTVGTHRAIRSCAGCQK